MKAVYGDMYELLSWFRNISVSGCCLFSGSYETCVNSLQSGRALK